MDTLPKSVDVVVIGGAAAGLTAALFTARRGLSTAIVTKNIGGQLSTTVDVANFPGIDYITGPNLALTMHAQAASAGAKTVITEVTALTPPTNPGEVFTITTTAGTITAKAVIIALGKTPRNLDVPGERELLGKGVSYAAAAELGPYRDKTVAIVGGGGSAFVALRMASKLATHAHLIHRSDTFRAETAEVERLRQAENITWHTFCEVTAINGRSQVESVTIKNSQTAAENTIPVTAVFIEVGFMVKPDLFVGLVDLTPQKQIIINNRGETSQPGLFAAGDITNSPFNQAIISAGEGARAALAAYTYVTGKPAGADWGT